MKAQNGFTLIELIVVIVILGILAATALPKFIDLSVDAENASAAGVAGALSSASSINYAKYKVQGNSLSGGLTSIDNGVLCSNATLSGLLTGGFPPNVNVTGPVGGIAGCAAGAVTTSCSVAYSATGTTAVSATLVCTR